MSEKDLKEYIRRVYILEKSMCEQGALFNTLSKKIEDFSKDEKIIEVVDTNGSYTDENVVERFAWYDLEDSSPYRRIKDKKEDTSSYFSPEGFVGLFLLSLLVGFAGMFFSDGREIIYNRVISALWLGVKVAFCAYVIFIAVYAVINMIRFLINRLKCNRANREAADYNAETIKNNDIAYKQRKIQLKNMIAEAGYLQGVSMRKTWDILCRFYSLDIIAPKYRNLAAVASFCEYFESGKCSALAGREGAYNIFEYEVRLNHIVQNPYDVNKKPEEVKRSQHMLYEAIAESREQTRKIFSEIEAVQNPSVNILENTSVAAYNLSISKQAEEFLKWYENHS